MIAKNILVATDFSELGHAAVEQAVSLAEKLGARLSVVSVYSSADVSEAFLTNDQAESLRQLHAHMDQLEQQLKPSGRLARATVQFGEPAPTILLSAKELDADLIVMGTHGRRGINRLLMGSTAEHVLRHAEIPVLIVKASERAPGTAAATV